jgi:DNA repair exonuclease SbcCD nuclease subunit
MYRAIFLADLHVSNSLPYAHRLDQKSPVTDRLVDTLKVLDEAARYAVENEIGEVYVVGDLLDRRLLDAVTLKAAKEKLVEVLIDEYGLNVTLVPGNHEAYDAGGSAYTLEAFANLRPDRLRVWGPEMATVLTDSARIVGLPYKPEDETRKSLDGLADREVTVVLLHQSLAGGRVGDWVCPEGLSEEDLAGFRFTIAGHFHSKQTLPSEKAMYLGAPMQHNFGDAGDERGFWDVKIGTKRVQTTFVESRAPRFHIVRWGQKSDKPLPAKSGDYVQIDVSGTAAQLKTKLPEATEFGELLKTHHGVRLVKVRPLLVAEKKARLQLVDVESGKRITWPAVVEGYLDGCDLAGLERRRLEELARAALAEAEQAR